MGKILSTCNVLIVVLFASGISFASWTQHGIDWNFPDASAVVARDIDGDGDPDVVGASLNGIVNWYENDGYAQFTGHLVAQGITNARYLGASDLDNDDDMDLVVACSASWPGAIGLYRLMNNGAMQFTVVQMNDTYRFYDLAVLDMDEDGDIDIVGTYNVSFDPVLSWWENRENGQVFVEHTLLTDVGNGFGTADMDYDGDMDLVVSGDTSILWLENNGDQTFTSHTVGTGLSSNDVNAGDLDSDGDLDVLAREYNCLRWYHNDGNQVFSQVSEIPGPLWMHEIQIMDVDGDGCMDVSCISGTWGYVRWLENFLCRVFQDWTISQPSVGTVSYDTCDFNDDGHVDFAVTGTMTANNIQWYENVLSPTVKLQIAPVNPPIVIPPQGGEFSFDIWIWNTTSDTLPTDFWASVEDEWAHIYIEPIILIPDIALMPDTLVIRRLTQRVPAILPWRDYGYTGKVGEFPDNDVDYGGFAFTKERGDIGAGPAIMDWSSTGDSFKEESDFILYPSAFSLLLSPNPFNSSTTISYQLSPASFVNLSVYNVSGREVTELVNGWREAGYHEVIFDGSGLAGGVYIYRFKAGNHSTSGKMIYLK